MTDDEIKTAVMGVLTRVAPDVEPDTLEPELNFRDQFDFDSVDFLRFALGLNEVLGVEIPEYDYPKLSSLRGCIDYLAGRLRASEQP